MRVVVKFNTEFTPFSEYESIKEWVIKDGLLILTHKDEKRGVIIPVNNILRINIELEDDDPEGSV